MFVYMVKVLTDYFMRYRGDLRLTLKCWEA